MSREYHEAKNLWRDITALVAMEECLRFLDLIEKAAAEKNDSLQWPLWIAFITTYARPFTNNDDMGMISDKAIPPDVKSLHQGFLGARNMFYGHTNPFAKCDTGAEANRLFITKHGNKIGFAGQTLCPHIVEIPRIKKLVKAMADDLERRTDKGRDHFRAALAKKPDGNYMFQYPKKPNEQTREQL